MRAIRPLRGYRSSRQWVQRGDLSLQRLRGRLLTGNDEPEHAEAGGQRRSNHTSYAIRFLAMMGEFVRPAWLKSGDLIRVVAPAGPFDRTLFFRGLSFLRENFRVTFEPACQQRLGFCAGPPERRLAELNRALRCREASAVVAARGGFGSGQIAIQADFAALRRHPKWLVGFSDITALHVEAQRHGLQSLHAANVTGLGPGDALGREAWLSALMNPAPLHCELRTLVPGYSRGPLIGGNLALIEACAAMGRLRVPGRAILFIEDVGERPYRIDRMLTTLAGAGAFDRLSGILLGHFTHCAPGRDGVTVFSVVEKHAQRHGLPCAYGLSAGHEHPNRPCRLGAEFQLDAADTAVLRELA